MLARSAISTPSLVVAGTVASARSRALTRDAVGGEPIEPLPVGGIGRDHASPDAPSIASSALGPAARSARSNPVAPTTAGMPYARARIKACAVGEERSRAMPRIRSRGRVAVSDGGRSSATTMAGRSRLTAVGTPAACRAMRSATSRTSVARERRSSSSIAARSFDTFVAAVAIAPTALTLRCWISLRPPR